MSAPYTDPLAELRRAPTVEERAALAVDDVTLHRSPDGILVLEQRGDSMEPEIRPGERVAVDTNDRLPTPGGLFLVYDGFGAVVMRAEHIPHSSPPTVRLWYDNPKYRAHERPVANAHIQGRVVGVLKRC